VEVVDVDPAPERRSDLEEDPLLQAVAQGVAEVRWRNALVVAGVRLFVGVLGLTFLGLGGLFPGRLAPALVVPALLVYLGFALVAAWLLRRRWRVTAVAAAAAVVDIALVSSAILAATEPGAASFVPLGYMVGILLLLPLFGALALPARLAGPLAVAAILVQLALGLRAGIPVLFLALGTVCACAFAGVVIWASRWMVKLAAERAVTEATASMAANHARAMEAAHAEIAAQRDRLVAAQNEAEALAQLIVHDLKNPLAALLQYISLAEAELKTVEGAAGLVDYLESASAEGRRLSKLIGDLLLVYRLERGVMAPAREQVPLALVLLSVVRRHALRAEERGVVVEVEADEDLMVAADLDLVQRMLENLLSNALRHVGRGDRVRMDARLSDGRLRIAVRNSGPPVVPELRGRLFDRFVSGGRREWQNAGLGLYLCRLVAEAHAGSIALVDVPGWNVSFEVNMPMSPAAAEASAPAQLSAAR
jgi:signal transduction histidine kinase